MSRGGGFFKYVTRAFTWHWNLLALGAGLVFGFVSGRPDVVLPLLAAGELVFLAGLSTRPRFQKAVDAEDIDTSAQDAPRVGQDRLAELLNSLPKPDRVRFEQLKALCLEMGRISRRVKGPAAPEAEEIGAGQMEGLNRLLWLYLKLLASKNALEGYFRTTRYEDIERVYNEAGERLKSLGPPEEDDENEVRYRASLEETIETSRQRMDNYRTVRENYEFLGLEQERLYAKIAHLAEMGINRQDAGHLTREIDIVSGSVEKTEKTLGELDFLTELSVTDAEPPDLLKRRRRRTLTQTR